MIEGQSKKLIGGSERIITIRNDKRSNKLFVAENNHNMQAGAPERRRFEVFESRSSASSSDAEHHPHNMNIPVRKVDQKEGRRGDAASKEE